MFVTTRNPLHQRNRVTRSAIDHSVRETLPIPRERVAEPITEQIDAGSTAIFLKDEVIRRLTSGVCMTANASGATVPVLLILTGLPFSGKSALSKDLANALGDAVHVEIDRINTERGLGIGEAPISAMDWSETYRVAYERAEQALSTSLDVVFDATNYSRAQRDILRMTARRAGAESAVIFVDTPVDECRARWLANRESGERYDVREDDFQRVVDRFDAPQADERVLLYYPGMTVDDLVSGLRQVFGR